MNPTSRMILAAVATGCCPRGPLLIRRSVARGVVFLVVITLTFWTGVAIGG